MMNGYPETIRREHMAAACEALGVPGKHIMQLSMDVQGGITAVVALAGEDGRHLYHAGQIVTTVLEIPIDDSPPRTD